MAKPILYDAVTLNNFGAINRLDILRTRHVNHDEPRWTEAVMNEIKKGAQKGYPHCTRVMAETWLGQPAKAPNITSSEFYYILAGLNDGRIPPQNHLGEAESIFIAEHCEGTFISDDAGAYDFARRRHKLGRGKVKDTVDILRDAVAVYELTCDEAVEIINQIEMAGRHIRKEHRGNIDPSYFS